MKIVDFTTAFFELANQQEQMTLEMLDQYYDQYPELFEMYFKSHGKRTPERMTASLERYPSQLRAMQQVAAQLPGIIREVMEQMTDYFGVELDLEFGLLVGVHGSNAFVDRKRDIYFAVEKLSCDVEHLRVIVAHEIAHIYHFHLLTQAQFDWSKLAWDGYTSLYFEGVATYVSQQVVPGLPESVYFSYDDEGEEWLTYSRGHQAEILRVFKQDLVGWTMELEAEWFRLRGGKHFGHTRLGYYLGTEFVTALAYEMGVREMMTFWADQDLREVAGHWMNSMSIVS